jgi:hypothetical protein
VHLDSIRQTVEIRGIVRKVDQAWLRPDAIPNAENALSLFDKYGAHDWYDWSVKNWGTKWNAYHFEMREQDAQYLHFIFDTAWSFPEALMESLAERLVRYQSQQNESQLRDAKPPQP